MSVLHIQKQATSEQGYFLVQEIHSKKNLSLPNDQSQLGSDQKKQGNAIIS